MLMICLIEEERQFPTAHQNPVVNAADAAGVADGEAEEAKWLLIA